MQQDIANTQPTQRLVYTEQYIIQKLASVGEDMAINNIVLNVLQSLGTGFIMAGLFDLIVFNHRGVLIEENAGYPVDSTHAGGMRYVPIEVSLMPAHGNTANLPMRDLDVSLLSIPHKTNGLQNQNGSTWKDALSSNVILMIDQFRTLFIEGNTLEHNWMMSSGIPEEQQAQHAMRIQYDMLINDTVARTIIDLVDVIFSEVYLLLTKDTTTPNVNAMFEMEENYGQTLSFTNVFATPAFPMLL